WPTITWRTLRERICAADWDERARPANPTSGPWLWPNRSRNAVSSANGFGKLSKNNLPVSICSSPERLLNGRGNHRPDSQGKNWSGCRRCANDFREFQTQSTGRSAMRFLVMVKYNENGTPPPQALLDAIAKNRLEAKQAGVLLEVGGLFPSAVGSRIRLSGGRLTVTDGP